MSTRFARTLPFGATTIEGGGTRFRLWAPGKDSVSLELIGQPPLPMRREEDGTFDVIAQAPAGSTYRYRVAPDLAVPDPAARAQDGDVHDASVVVDPAAYDWRFSDWQGRPWHEVVLYELHAGAMGGFAGVAEQLPRLAKLGITAVELMPINAFPGERNWGYDGVLPYAPDSTYGTPDELKHLIDTAHGLDMMVMLDVVYNHFGPDGNYIGAYAPGFFREDVQTPWGAAIDFRKPQVRRYFIENALYWLMEYRFDGLRFDAVHAIGDKGFLQEMAAEIRATVEPGRHVHLVLENEENTSSLLRTAPDAPGYDAQWSDDAHNSLHVLLTGETEAYYASFTDGARLLARCLGEGFAYQGDPFPLHDNKPRGEPSAGLPPTDFVMFLQNHDQIGNRAFGERLTRLADPDALRAATLLLLLSPQIPMIFMGDEWGSRQPFLFFTGHHDELADLVREGRRKEFARFAAFADAKKRETIPDPNAPDTFRTSIPDPAEAAKPEHASWQNFYLDQLRLRRRQIVPRLPGTTSLGAQVLGDKAVRAAWRLGDGAVLTIACNFGTVAVACDAGGGNVLVSTGEGWSGGTLSGRSALAWLDVPA